MPSTVTLHGRELGPGRPNHPSHPAVVVVDYIDVFVYIVYVSHMKILLARASGIFSSVTYH